MSRRDFELIASVLKQANVSEGQRFELTLRFADALKSTNPRFDTERFVKAATPPRYAPCAVFSSSLGTVWRVRDRQTNGYVPTMPRTFVARESAQASADNLNRP